MCPFDLYLAQQMPVRRGNGCHNYEAQAVRAALALHRRALVRGWWGKVWSALTGNSHRLLSLALVRDTCTVRGCCRVGIKTMPLRQIRGSEGRCDDYDIGFRPVQTHTRGRWLSVATACQLRVTLPPVELIQVGDIYFVRDGHHRISVARALGQKYIEAEVTAWQVAGPLSKVTANQRRLYPRLSSQPALADGEIPGPQTRRRRQPLCP
jgi:hypothetical protein